MSKYSNIVLLRAERTISSDLARGEERLLKLREGTPQFQSSNKYIRAFQIALALIQREEGIEDTSDFSRDELSRALALLGTWHVLMEKALPEIAVDTPQYTLVVEEIFAYVIAEQLIQAELQTGY